VKVEHVKTGEIRVDKWYDLRSLRRHFYVGEDPLDRIEREIKLQSVCEHPHIQSLIEVIDCPISRSVHLIQPFAPLGSLQSTPSPPPLRPCFAQIASALDYLHSRGIAHRDVKPGNILCFPSGRFVLSDFSSASALGPDGVLEDTQGSPAFLSPEECRGGAFDGRRADTFRSTSDRAGSPTLSRPSFR
jgi:serine/threonine protein kinase